MHSEPSPRAGGRATLSLSRKGPACVLGARPASGPWLCKHFLPLRGLSLHFLDSMNAILKPSNTERRIPRLPLILRVSRKDVGSDPKSETTPCGLGQVSSPSGPPFPVVGGPSAWWRWNVNSACQQTGQEDTAWPADALGGRRGGAALRAPRNSRVPPPSQQRLLLRGVLLLLLHGARPVREAGPDRGLAGRLPARPVAGQEEDVAQPLATLVPQAQEGGVSARPAPRARPFPFRLPPCPAGLGSCFYPF